jgi:hypothetical protein
MTHIFVARHLNLVHPNHRVKRQKALSHQLVSRILTITQQRNKQKKTNKKDFDLIHDSAGFLIHKYS